MLIKNVRLGVSSVTRRKGEVDFEVLTASHYGDSVSITVAAVKGDTLRVKLPAEVAERIDRLAADLEAGMEYRVIFDGLILRQYAFLSEDGKLQAGVSASAEDFSLQPLDPTIDL